MLRGLHYQLPPHAQGKLVRVVTRARCSTSRWTCAAAARPSAVGSASELSAENQQQLWIPPGFAHGFLVLSESADFLYKTTDYYAPAAEGPVRWNDPRLAIDWPVAGHPPLLSAKDASAPDLASATCFA